MDLCGNHAHGNASERQGTFIAIDAHTVAQLVESKGGVDAFLLLQQHEVVCASSLHIACVHGAQLALDKAMDVTAHERDLPPPRRRLARALYLLFQVAAFAWHSELRHAVAEPLAPESQASVLGPEEIYESLQEISMREPPRPSCALPALPQLRPTLRRYQQDAVQWMIAREESPHLSAQLCPRAPHAHATLLNKQRNGGHRSDTISLLWRRLDLPIAPTEAASTADRAPGSPHSSSLACETACASHLPVYWNPWNGALVRELPPPPPPIRGGILADEMGLGKTIC
eukprot:4395398-Pleurochrysis_carterae.AAC.1